VRDASLHVNGACSAGKILWGIFSAKKVWGVPCGGGNVAKHAIKSAVYVLPVREEFHDEVARSGVDEGEEGAVALSRRGKSEMGPHMSLLMAAPTGKFCIARVCSAGRCFPRAQAEQVI